MTTETPNEVKEAKLTAKQELFVKEYLIDLNATQACIRAGYSESTAQQMGSENLSKPVIQKAISKLKKQRNKELEVDSNYVLNRLLEIDQLDILDILDNDGHIKPVNEWSEKWRKNISSFEVAGNEETGEVVKLKFPDKVKNLELIGKHIQVGAWVSNSKVDITTNGESIQPTTIELVAPSLEDMK